MYQSPSLMVVCPWNRPFLNRRFPGWTLTMLLPLALAGGWAGCALPRPAERADRVVVQTEHQHYKPAVREVAGRYRTVRSGDLRITVTIANGSQRVVYPAECGGGFLQFALEERRDTAWAPVYWPVCLTGGGGPREIRPGESVTGTVTIIEQRSKEVFQFQFPKDPQMYRLVFSLHEAPFQPGQGFGLLLPPSERTSNCFVIAPP